MRSRVSIFILTCGLLIFACQQKQEPTHEPSIMYEASELARLMRNMHDTLLVWKNDVQAGDSVYIHPQYFEGIHTAQATNPDEINDAFYLLASSFEQSIYTFNKTQDITSYNLVVNSCVTCHKSYCQGPIPKIEKLYIEP
ncbi:MAG: hypothetical protein ACPG4Z_01650 [Chitinophagales bacterium]